MSYRVNAFFILVLTILLMSLGAYLHDAELGSNCPTWPLCPGKFSDQVLIYFHRFVALCLMLLSISLTLRLKKIQFNNLKWSYWVTGLILLQAILGALTAVLELPAIISFVHLILSLVTVAFIVVLHDSLADKAESPKKELPVYLKDLLLTLLILFFIQSLLGGLVRHTGAGSACGVGINNLLACTDQLSGTTSYWPFRAAGQLQMLHRFSGIVLFIFALPTLLIAFFSYSSLEGITSKKARNTALLSILLIFVQVYSGFYNIASSLAVHATVFHLILAAAMMAFILKTRLYHQELEISFGGKERTSFFTDTLELFKPRLAGLVMATMLIGALLAPGKIYILDIFISFGLIFMVVASATTLNCWMEKDLDALMERTKERALPSGRMKPQTAFAIGIILALVSLPALYFIVNPLTAFLGLLAHLMYLLAYTPLKKHSATALFVGAVPGALPPVMGWTTMTGSMDTIAWCLFAILFVWQLPHFLAISVYYRGDYEAAGIKVFARKTNFSAVRRDIFLYTGILMACALAPVWWGDFGKYYETSATVLSLGFLAWAIFGFFIENSEEASRQWARRYFFASIIYLPLLLAAMVFFQ